jgi:hypothetical protein
MDVSVVMSPRACIGLTDIADIEERNGHGLGPAAVGVSHRTATARR